MRSKLLALVLVSIAGSSSGALGQDGISGVHDRFRESLVRVKYTQQVRFSTAEPAQEEELTTGGLIVSADGIVMVSAIVYEPFNQVPHGVGVRFPASLNRTEAEIGKARVGFGDGTEYPAEFLGRDQDADVAFFRIVTGSGAARAFRPVGFGATPLPALGQSVLVLSLLPEPLGPGISVERSEVQAVVSRPSSGFLVTTVAADPVGALVTDLKGTPVGMLDALTVPTPESTPRNPLAIISVLRSLPRGLGRAFARPATTFASAAARPPSAQVNRRGWLGILMQALSPETASHLKLPVTSGVIVAYVYKRSPAERAGLETGDVLTALEGDPIRVQNEEDLGPFSERVLRSGAGAALKFAYLREGQSRETVADLGAAPRSVNEARTLKVDELDLTAREVTFDYLAALNLDPDKKGVVIEKPPVPVRTNPNRIVRGDLLVRIGNHPVDDLDSFRAVVDELRKGKDAEVVLFLERGRESFFFALKPDWK